MPQIGTLAISLEDVTQDIFTRLDTDKASLGIVDVWYGDQRMLPNFPCVEVSAGNKRRGFNGTRRWDLTFQVILMLHHEKIQTTSDTRLENELKAEALEQYFLSNDDTLTLSGKVVFSYITQVEPGVVARGSVMMQSTRLTWQGTSREEF